MTFTPPKRAKRSSSSKALSLVLLALSLAPALGCVNNNIAECEAYVDAANAALIACNRDPIYEAADTCPDTLADGPDCSLMYQCLAAGYTCDTATMTVNVNTADCTC